MTEPDYIAARIAVNPNKPMTEIFEPDELRECTAYFASIEDWGSCAAFEDDNAKRAVYLARHRAKWFDVPERIARELMKDAGNGENTVIDREPVAEMAAVGVGRLF